MSYNYVYFNSYYYLKMIETLTVTGKMRNKMFSPLLKFEFIFFTRPFYTCACA